jgi:hypothetical protein
MDFSVEIRIKDNLGQAPTVTQVDEDQAPMIAAAVDPASQGDLLSGMFRAKLVTGIGSKHALFL